MIKNVLLIGWFNAQPKHMNRYINLYKKLGLERTKSLLYDKEQVLSLTKGKQFCDFYKNNKELDDHYSIIHTFSGGSLIAFYLKMIGISYDKLIIDSGPMYLTSECFANYISNYPENNNGIMKPMIKPISKLIIENIWKWEMNRCSIVNKNFNYFINNYENDSFLNSYHPKLIINNPNDKLVLHEKVFEMNKNNNITFQNFYKSKHVQHYKKYPDEYRTCIYNFLQM